MTTLLHAGADPLDAYLEWFLAARDRRLFERFRMASDPPMVGLLLSWKTQVDAARAVGIARANKVQVAKLYAGSEGRPARRHWAVSVPLAALPDFLDAAAPLASRIELAAPSGEAELAPMESSRSLVRSSSPTLLGVLDDGCAFANTRLMAAGSSRVKFLWNQDPAAFGLETIETTGPQPLPDFSYGRHLPGHVLDNFILSQQGRQDAIYAEAGLRGLRRAAAHGAHVADLLCRASDAEIVFVQFPAAGIDDPSGQWLHRFAFDGLHYVVDCAGPATKTIVVNLSWGPQTGPHDGSSVLEVAIDALVEEQRLLKRELIVTMAAGNSHRSRAHGQIDCRVGGHIAWSVPPDGHTRSFLEIWWPPGVDPTPLRVVPPGGSAVPVIQAMPKVDDWHAVLKVVGQSAMACLVVDPTEGPNPSDRGRHGRWRLEFDASPASAAGHIDIYVARADHNMGARRRAKASYLTDPELEAARFVAPARRHDEAVGSKVRRAGTLSGVATGRESKVAAGYRHSDGIPAPYSSAGPTRGLRAGPDFACVTDISASIAGIRAAGVRSGTTFRLVGTSSAAPQLGRKLAADNKEVLAHRPGHPDQVERVGGGRMPPDPDVIPPR